MSATRKTGATSTFSAQRVAQVVRDHDVDPHQAALALVNQVAAAQLFPPAWDAVPDLDLPGDVAPPETVEQIGEVHQLLLGRQDEQRGEQGSYYTPDALSQFMARFTGEIVASRMRDAHPLDQAIIDPACGAGVLLVDKGWELCARLLHLERTVIEQHGAGQVADELLIRGLMPFVARDCLYGIDIDPVAVALAKSNLWLATDGSVAIDWMDRNFVVGDALNGALPPALIDRYGSTERAADAVHEASASQLSLPWSSA